MAKIRECYLCSAKLQDKQLYAEILLPHRPKRLFYAHANCMVDSRRLLTERRRMLHVLDEVRKENPGWRIRLGDEEDNPSS